MNVTRILLVDDEINYIEALAKRLGRRGFEVSTAGSGDEALRLLQTESFDVTVLDVTMPGKDGVETLVEIRKRHPQVKTIMLTARADSNLAVSCRAMGALDYLIKPVDFDQLVWKLDWAALWGEDSGDGMDATTTERNG